MVFTELQQQMTNIFNQLRYFTSFLCARLKLRQLYTNLISNLDDKTSSRMYGFFSDMENKELSIMQVG